MKDNTTTLLKTETNKAFSSDKVIGFNFVSGQLLSNSGVTQMKKDNTTCDWYSTIVSKGAEYFVTITELMDGNFIMSWL